MKHKKCLMCRVEYDYKLTKCPRCGSSSFAKGYGPISSTNSLSSTEDTPSSNMVVEVVEALLDVAVVCASSAAEIASNTFDSLPNIDFGGGGAGDLFD